jgi:hypothetical protein
MKISFLLLGLTMIFSLVLSGCSEIDVSSLSDEDLERISEKAVVCNEPYIRIGVECCLDTNGNNICDSDESEATEIQDSTDEIPETIVAEPSNPTCTHACRSDECVGLELYQCSFDESTGCNIQTNLGKIQYKCNVGCTSDADCSEGFACKDFVSCDLIDVPEDLFGNTNSDSDEPEPVEDVNLNPYWATSNIAIIQEGSNLIIKNYLMSTLDIKSMIASGESTTDITNGLFRIKSGNSYIIPDNDLICDTPYTFSIEYTDIATSSEYTFAPSEPFTFSCS